jgi:hypothetical protein
MNFRRLIASSDAQEYAKLGFSIGEAKQEFQADEMGHLFICGATSEVS